MRRFCSDRLLVFFIYFAAGGLSACSNKLSITSAVPSAAGVLDSVGESSGSALELREDLAEVSKSVFSTDKSASISSAGGSLFLLAGSKGKGVLLDVADGKKNEISVAPPAGQDNPVWIFPSGENGYWALSNGTLFFKGQNGSEISEIEESLNAILEEETGKFRPVYVGKSDLVGIHKKRIFWLSAESQLKREFYLEISAATLGNREIENIKAAGIIKGRGVWLLNDDYLIFIVRASNGNFSVESKRFKGFFRKKKKIVPERLFMRLAPDESGKIKVDGIAFLQNEAGVFTTAKADAKE